MGKASALLLRQTVWLLLVATDQGRCFRCGGEMSLADYSLDHAEPWRGQDAALFWDPNNIHWSHKLCNTKAARTVTPSQDARRRIVRNGLLRCSFCKKDLPVSQFWKSSKVNCGYNSLCKACDIAKRNRVRSKVDMPDKAHGTISGYEYYRCRCDKCREVSRRYRMERAKIKMSA
jgi:hypothetical protein